MRLIGLTGGMGMGKSTSAKLLEEQGIPVVDTDRLAREVVEPGQPALREIRDTFGPGLVDSDDRLCREKLAALVFADAAERRRLEAILHPRIRELWLAQVEVWRVEERFAGVVVIPLLFETGAVDQFDEIICVACSGSSQWQRLLNRGWDRTQIEQRLAAQWPVEKKMDAADYVIWTEPDLKTHAEQLSCVIERLRQRAG